MTSDAEPTPQLHEVSALCASCVACLNDTAKVQARGPGILWYAHHATAHDFWYAVRNGCRACTALWRTASGQHHTTTDCEMPMALRSHRCSTLKSATRPFTTCATCVTLESAYFLILHGKSCSDRRLSHFQDKLFFVCPLQQLGEQTRQLVSTQTLATSFTVGQTLAIETFIGNRGLRHIETLEQELPGTSVNSLLMFSESRDGKEKSSHVYGPPSVAMGSTGQPSVLATAAQWLHDCQSTPGHDACNLGLRPLWAPKRLIETNVLSADHTFRIVEIDEMDATPPQYIALSHRWGDGDFLHLQETNAESLKLPHKVEILPQTFQDAIRVCRALGIRWLWIDSLCILQGKDDASRRDWAEQAPEMCEVYGNASCKISATETRTAHEGLFHARDSGCIASVRHDFAASSPIASRSHGPAKCELVDTWHFEKRISESPLSKRAWAFQERILSRRSIHFMNDRLVWECRAFTTDERYPSHGPAIPANLKDLDLFHSHGPDGTNCRFCKNWWQQVELFSACDITHLDDRPAAIAGFARKVADISGCMYLAGLWREHLEQQLLWSASSIEHSGRWKSVSYRKFPSWSWLSIDASIRGPLMPESEAPEVFETASKIIDIFVGTGDLETGVQHGTLTVQGIVRHIKLSETVKCGVLNWVLSRPLDASCCDCSKASYRTLANYFSQPDYTRRFLPARTHNSEHYILYMGSHRLASRDSLSHWMILEVVDADFATYRQLGLLRIPAPTFPNYADGPVPDRDVDWMGEGDLKLTDLDLTYSAHPLDALAPGTPAATPGEHVIHLV